MHTEIEWVARSLGFSRVYYIDPSLEKTGYGLPAFTKPFWSWRGHMSPTALTNQFPHIIWRLTHHTMPAMPLYQILGEWGRVLRGLTSR